MRKKHILYILLFLSTVSTAQNFPKANDFKAHDRFVDIDTISLNLIINPLDKTVEGSARISYDNLSSKVDSFFIHAVNFNLKLVLLNGEKANYKYLPKGGMWIYPQSKSEKRNILEIEYSAKPRKGLFFVGWDDKYGIRKKQIWTQGQGIDNRYWFPSYDLQDEKAIYNLTVSFPKEYNLLASGELLSKEINDSNFQWHYCTKHPMSSYLVMLAGGEYKFQSEKFKGKSESLYAEKVDSKFKVQSKKAKVDEVQSSKLKAERQSSKAKGSILTANSKQLKGINFQYWYYTGDEDKIEPTYRYNEDIMLFFENEIGVKYPWNKYAQIPVSDFKHGAMENTEATIFSDVYVCNDTSFNDRNYISVNAHEMAHQWFGDAITCSSAKHHWLHEGFATFYQLKAIEKFIGEDDFLWEKKKYRDQIFAISQRDSLPLAHPKAGTERFYYKGAFVLMMLEQKLGEQDFMKAISKYVEDNLYGVVETETLKLSFEKTLNIDLTTFFNQWVYGYGEPKIEIKYFCNGRKKGLALKQLNGIYDVEIPFVTTRRSSQEKIIFELKSETDTLFFNKKIDFFEVDPNIESLAEYTIEKPEKFWQKQVVKASSAYSKFLAVKYFSSLPEKEKLKLFSKIDLANENHKVLAEVYSQIKDLETELNNKILRTTDIELRKDIISQTKIIDKSNRKYFESYLDTKSYLVIAGSLDLLCKSFPEKADEYLAKTKNVSGESIPYVKLSWLKNTVIYGSVTNREKQKFADELVSFTSNSYEFNTRLLALNNVFEIQYLNRQLLLNLINGSVSFNHHLVGPFRQVMKEFVKNDSFKKELSLILEEELSEAERKYLVSVLDN